MRPLAITATAVIAIGLSTPGAAQAAANNHGHALAPAQTCSIMTSTGTCFSAGEFCPHADLGLTTTAANGDPIRCVQDGQFTRWLNAAAAASPAPVTTSSPATTVPVGGIPAGAGGLAQGAQSGSERLPIGAGLAAGALAAASVVVIRRRRGRADR